MDLGFLGEYEYSVDDKGRISIPPKFRPLFKDGIILCRGWDQCITVYPPEQWQKTTEIVTSRPPTQSRSRRLNRHFFAGASSTELDGQGRVVLPSYLREYADIKEAAVLIGVNSYLEIWSKRLWAEEERLSEEEAKHIAETLEVRP
ncbi:MAG: division/cell wall cluster transcriptional repressor MraZ [Chloroflexi bacterium]|nr:division/cell wall cluster transcriptional repressor MraZ [Chloroflexota bacterium]